MSGAPDCAPDAPATPTPAALRNAITCSRPSKPARSGVAVMLAFVSFAVARAVQTSDTPACESLRLTSDQVSPPPVTVVRCCAAPRGPSAVTNATSCSPAAAVVSAVAVSVPRAWRVTLVSIEIVAGGGALLSTVTRTDVERPMLPAASVASAVSVCWPGDAVRVSHDVENGGDGSGPPSSCPSTLNCTPVTPTLSDATAPIWTMPLTVLPGSDTETCGGVESIGGDS